MTDPKKIVVMGDTHCNTRWVCSQIPLIAEKLKDEPRKIILQVGDFGYWPRTIGGSYYLEQLTEALAEHPGMELWFIDGNHEDHDSLAELERTWADMDGDLPASIGLPQTGRIRWLTRGYRWWWHGRQWLAMGGATSLDRNSRVAGLDWFPGEAITGDQVTHAVASGPVDVMVTHDCPSSVSHSHPDYGFPYSEIRKAEEHSRVVQKIVDGTQPRWLIHGHFHMLYSRPAKQHYGECQVTGLNMDGTEGNWFAIDTETMRWDTEK